MAVNNRRTARLRRHVRVRRKISGTTSIPRLCVFRSPNHIYAQIVDDSIGHTLVAASTLDAELREEVKGKTKTGKSELVGALIARRAKDKGIEKVAFDRGGFLYHGRVKALADAARQEGLKF
ncbi:MAG: 50S ribosomal protein L18 [Dehalococcoidales bacterium]|nr:50S ribosomal protein L18 [Dehalococcoidales bacterium]